MTGRERVQKVLTGEQVDRPPLLPIIHTALAPLFGIRLSDYFTQPEVMADVTLRGARQFAFDGVQMSLGVTAEAQALGAEVEQPDDAAPILLEHLLADMDNLDALRQVNPTTGGRMRLFFQAVEKVVHEIGGEKYVLVTLRGPLLGASQLRGVQEILMDLLEQPEEAEKVLDFTSEVTLTLGKWLVASGAHGLALGEATCSPNLISPNLYRKFVLPRHRRLVAALKEAGWKTIGFHICGNTTAIIESVISTGADFMDIDYQVPAGQALALAKGRIALRGNLNPAPTCCWASRTRFGPRPMLCCTMCATPVGS